MFIRTLQLHALSLLIQAVPFRLPYQKGNPIVVSMMSVDSKWNIVYCSMKIKYAQFCFQHWLLSRAINKTGSINKVYGFLPHFSFNNILIFILNVARLTKFSKTMLSWQVPVHIQKENVLKRCFSLFNIKIFLYKKLATLKAVKCVGTSWELPEPHK